MENLEKYIRENRAQLDHIEKAETDLIWLGIQGQLQTRERADNNQVRFVRIPLRWAMAIAASIVLLIAVSIWHTTVLSQQSKVSQLTTYFPELEEQEKAFQTLIAQKEAALNLSDIDKTAFEELFEELSILEQVQQEYLSDLPQFNQKDQLVEVLIKYYERKIRILERLSKEIEKRKYHENLYQEQSL